MRWFKWFFDRVCKTNTHTFTGRQHLCKKKIILPAIKTKWRRRILVQTELFMGIFMSSTRNSSSNVRSNCVLTSNYQHHLSCSYKQQKKINIFPHKTDFRSFSDLPIPHFLLLFTLAQEYGPRQANLCLRAFLVMKNFNCSCPVIQRGQGSGFLSEGSS